RRDRGALHADALPRRGRGPAPGRLRAAPRARPAPAHRVRAHDAGARGRLLRAARLRARAARRGAREPLARLRPPPARAAGLLPARGAAATQRAERVRRAAAACSATPDPLSRATHLGYHPEHAGVDGAWRVFDLADLDGDGRMDLVFVGADGTGAKNFIRLQVLDDGEP